MFTSLNDKAHCGHEHNAETLEMLGLTLSPCLFVSSGKDRLFMFG